MTKTMSEAFAAMSLTGSRQSAVLRSALITPVCLIGTFFAGALAGDAVHSILPAHLPEEAKVALALMPALGAVLAGGALWGLALARITHLPNMRRVMWAGALGYGPTVMLVALVLTVLEVLVVEQRRAPDLPLHVAFTLLFVPAVFVVATIGALALGLALQAIVAAVRLALATGLAAGLTFLSVDVLMDRLGWQVGAPGAVERATMLTVLLVSSLAASLAGGGVIGLLLSRRRSV